MRPTRWYVLVVLLAVAGGVSYGVTRSSYDSLPAPGIYGLLWLALFAVAETYIAVLTRARLAGRSGTKPIQPLVVARYVALAKASSVVGVLAAGGYGGFLVWVVPLDSPASHHDSRVAAVGAGCGLVLVAAALLLEYVCRVPRSDEEERTGQ